jgi:hypothetical protein
MTLTTIFIPKYSTVMTFKTYLELIEEGLTIQRWVLISGPAEFHFEVDRRARLPAKYTRINASLQLKWYG